MTEYLDKEAMQLKLRNYTAKSILLWKMGIGMLLELSDEVNRFKLDQKEKVINKAIKSAM